MWEFLDKVIYINLEEREDRREQIEEEFSVFPPEKVLRFNAIKHEVGLLGAVQSQIAVLEMAIQNGWNTILVAEDDCVWNNYDEGYAILDKIRKMPYDIIHLGATHVQYDNETYKLQYGQTCTAYIIRSHYYETLLNNFKESYRLGLTVYKNPSAWSKELDNYTGHDISHDVYWCKLQKTDNWYVIVPSMCLQRPGISDIQKSFQNYLHVFA